jgi:hypothetical protein
MIENLRLEINEELGKEKRNTAKLDRLIREFVIAWLDKYRGNEKAHKEFEIERLCDYMKKVIGTFNSIPSLITGIGSGIATMAAGGLNFGASIAGFCGVAQNTIKKVTDFGSSLDLFGRGLGALKSPIDAYNESQRTGHNHNAEMARQRMNSADQSANQIENLIATMLNNLSKTDESAHSIARTILSPGG